VGGELGFKLVRRIDRWVDVPAELFLGRRDSLHDIQEWRVSNYAKVDVACRTELVTCCRSEHEGDLDPVAQRRKCVAQDVDESRSFRKQSTQFWENRCFAIGLEVNLASLNGSTH